MKYINTFKTHASYEEKLNGGGVDISLPNVSYCEDVKDVHYNPYNTVEFYVGEITEPQTVSIYTDETNHVNVTVSEGNKWYTYLLPKDKGLYKIVGGSVKKVVVKADISFKVTYQPITIIPSSTVEASLKGSNTSNVTNMRWMFSGCSLTSLDLSGWNTSNVTNMNSMFRDCNSLTSLDLSGWNTSNVINMSDMFGYCSSLTSLDLSKWNTSNVHDIYQMFTHCSDLTSLDLSGWNISNVTDMNFMFYTCTKLTSLDLSSFNTRNVTNMRSMFNDCTSLTSLDLSGWDTSKVYYITDMFKGCTSLKKITMKDCSEATRTKIQEQLTKDNITGVTIVTK